MTTHRHRARGLAFLLAGLLSGPAAFVTACGDSPPPAPPRPDYGPLKALLRPRITEAMAEQHIRGLSLALVDGDEVVWAEGFGVADEAAGTPATADTVYEVGSVAKVFTATAVFQQAERGTLDLDAPIARSVPGFSLQPRFPNAKPITLRHLMTHRAGIPQLLAGYYADEPLSPEARVEALRDESPAYPPGTVSAYSNLGFVVVGRAVEVATGEAFSDALRHSVLAPLGMTSSSFRLDPDLVPRLAKGYGVTPASELPPTWLESEAPAGSLRSTVMDQTRFLRMLLAGGTLDGVTLLRPDSIAAQWSPQGAQTPLDLDLRIGLPWTLVDLPLTHGESVRWVDHSGSTFHFQSDLALLPDEGLGVVVLSNTENAGPLVEALARQVLVLALKAKRGVTVQEPPAEPQVQPSSRPDAELRALEGLYSTGNGPMAVRFDGGKLTLRLGDADVELVPYAQGYFRARTGDASLWLSFQRIDGHDVMLVHGVPFGRLLWGERIQPTALHPAWRARLGRFGVPPGAKHEALEQVVLREEQGFLFAELSGPALGDTNLLGVLRTEDAAHAVAVGLGRGMNEVIRVQQEPGGEALYVKGIRLPRRPDAP
ncbi:hypothetical protein DRW03_19410 [Corallococcus sp. H22C18031201]|nr:hypothetical protein DRW03_19410 [Corallococcus sp. H22C18031201]